MNLILADEVADGGIGNHHLERRDASLPGRPRKQRLTDDTLQHEGELRANLRLLIRGKHVNDTVDGLHRRIGVQGSEAKVAGLRCNQGRLNGFQIPHFADKDHVGVLAQDVLERLLERFRVSAHLALVDETLLVWVQILDGVFDGDDVFVPLGVDLVNHGGQAGRLARASGSGDQHQSTRLVAQLLNDRRQPQFGEGRYLERNGSKGAAHRPALHEEVCAKASQSAHTERKVQLAILLEVQLLGVGQDRIAELFRVHLSQRIDPQGNQHAVDAKLRRRTGGNVQVGGALLHHRLEQLLQVDRESTGLRGRRLIGAVFQEAIL